MEIASITHCTSNENGIPQIEIEYQNGFIRDLLRKPNRVEHYLFIDNKWLNAKTRKEADHFVYDIDRQTRQMSFSH